VHPPISSPRSVSLRSTERVCLASGPVTSLRDALSGHRPRDPHEATSLRRTLALLDWLRDPFDQHADPTHVTGSAIVLDGTGRVLLHRHKRLGTWLQPGGHLDPGETPSEAAIRETHEETGLRAVHPPGGARLVHVDVHQGPRGHVHLDLRYHLLADGTAPFDPAAGESPDIAWMTPAEATRRGDASLTAAVAAAFEPTIVRSEQP
jgi:8-oxo-dGTP pyrophosphatase MutT (NUDIX family)